MQKPSFKILSLLITAILLFVFGGCSGQVVEVDLESQTNTSAVPSAEPKVYLNPLTGLEGMDPAVENNRPVAVMINNLKTAQSVQTGLNKADVVYEAYAEGGVTRLLAVFKDINDVGNIGTVRSARYSFIDLALGHDAIYVHAGINESHATPHTKETGIDNINLLYGRFNGMSFRQKNGKAYEHTLYTSGEKLLNGFDKLDWRTELNYAKGNWQSFVDADSQYTPNGGGCSKLTVKMSASYVSTFEYDATTKAYKKFSGTSKHKDYSSGEQLKFKNVLVLKTTVSSMDSKNYLQKTHLTGGDGYYASNGGYQQIKWSKGDEKNPIKITLPDGSVCPYNPGNTWVCLVNKNNTVDITDPTAVSSAAASTK